MVWTVKWRLLSTAAQGSPAEVCWLLSSTPTATAFRRGSDPRYLEFLDSTTWNLTSEICDSRTPETFELKKSSCSCGGLTHHVDDLLQRDAEGEHERLRLVDDGPLEVVVAAHQVAEQLLLVVAAYRLCKGRPREAHLKLTCSMVNLLYSENSAIVKEEARKEKKALAPMWRRNPRSKLWR